VRFLGDRKMVWISAMIGMLLLGYGQVSTQVPVEVSEAVARSVTLSLNLVGSVEPLIASTIGSPRAGRVDRVLVEEDDRVVEGQVLARLEKVAMEVRHRQAEARRLQAVQEFERVKQLVEQNLTSLERLQQAETNVALRTADSDLVKIALYSSDIRSPFSGVVAYRYAEIGEWISTGGKIVDLIQMDSLFVMTSVPEKHVRHLAPGLKASIRCDAQPDDTFTGEIHRVIPLADPASHAFPVKIIVPNTEGKLKPGMFARVDLQIEAAERLVLVPKDALVNIAGDYFVFEVIEGRVKRHKIERGRSDGDHIEVIGDVKPGATVVVTGNETLRDEGEVVVMKKYRGR
jgi:membrane fusion protein, multidrug efflux system